MARKRKPQPEETSIPPAAPSRDQRKGSRHRPRKMVALSPDLYDQLKDLADRNGRPVSWEIRLALMAHVHSNQRS